jgi:concanavalin A-like lectin/glucanase superfamily protein
MKSAAWVMICCLAGRAGLAQSNDAGWALSFNGSGYASIATTGSLSGTFTVEMWANPATNTPSDLLALLGSRSPNEYGFDMKFWLGHLIHGDLGNGNGWMTIAADAEYAYVPGDWVHLAYVVTPTNYTIYANGDLMAAADYPPDNPVLYDSNHQLTIAHIGYGPEYMTGQIDEVRIWSTARTRSEIQTNLQRRLTGSEPGLRGYWRFDEGGGPFINDASGHAFYGLLFSGAEWVVSTAPIGRLAAVTKPATAATSTAATLNGIIFPNSQPANTWFEYGTTTNYGNSTPLIHIDPSNAAPETVSSSISGLSRGTLYHFRLVATNRTTTSYGTDLSFLANDPPLLVNGGFETGDFTGWTQSGFTLENYVDRDPLDVHSGTYGAALGPIGTFGYLSQNLATAPGTSYLISCWLDSPDGEVPNEFSISWDGMNLFDEIDMPATGWMFLQFKAAATAPGTLLQFAFQNDLSYFGFDDVSVIPIPAPTFVPGGIALTNGEVALTWASLSGCVYQLQYTTGLNPPTWIDLGLPITAAASTTTAYDNPGADLQRFYRVALLP